VDRSRRQHSHHEVQVLDGKGKLTITGQLGDVMQESAQAALSYIRGRAQALGLTREFYRNVDLHLHVPEGAIPKDGPSAGITMATALASALTKIPVRRDIAMTGEITLRGKVLAIGGLKEKLLAALRAGIFEVILPRANEKDIAELPDNIKKSMKLHFVDQMDEVLGCYRRVEATPPPLIQSDWGVVVIVWQTRHARGCQQALAQLDRIPPRDRRPTGQTGARIHQCLSGQVRTQAEFREFPPHCA
jgi:predicted ATP-dependent protease